MFVEAVTERND